MKRVFSIVALAVMTLGFVSCENDSAEQDGLYEMAPDDHDVETGRD